MLFRFAAAVVLVVLIAVAAAMLESRALQRKREISRQQAREDVLLEERDRLRAQAVEAGTPLQTIKDIEIDARSAPVTNEDAQPLPNTTAPRSTTTVRTTPRSPERRTQVSTLPTGESDVGTGLTSPSVFRTRPARIRERN